MSTRTTLSTILLFTVITMSACMVGSAPDDDTLGGDGAGNGDGTGGGNGAGDDGAGDDDGTGGAGTGGDAAAVLEAIGAVECEQAHACKASFPADAGVTFAEAFGASVTACTAEAAAYYDPQAVEAGITAGTIEFDAAAATACLAGLAAVAAPQCASFWDQGPAFPQACGGVFTGTVDAGGSCTTDFECAAPNYCGEAGTCVADTAQRRASLDVTGVNALQRRR